MSSALQCLFHTEELVNYFFSKEYKNDLFNYIKSNSKEIYSVNHENNSTGNSAVNNFTTNNNNIDAKNNNAENDSKNSNNNSLKTNKVNNSNNDYSSNELNIELDACYSSNNRFSKPFSDINKIGNENRLTNANGIEHVKHFQCKLNDIDVNSHNENEISYKNHSEAKFFENDSKQQNTNNSLIKEDDIIVLDIHHSKENKTIEKVDKLLDNQQESNMNIDYEEANYMLKCPVIADKVYNNDLKVDNDNYNNIQNINEINYFKNSSGSEQDKKNNVYSINNKNNPNNNNNKNFNLHSNNDFNNLNTLNNSENKDKLNLSSNNVYPQNKESAEINIQNFDKKTLVEKPSIESFKTLPSIPILFQPNDEKEKQLILFTQNFKDLIQKMWSKSGDVINPKEFRESLICLNSQFNNFSQQDSHELLTFILESLHIKLNRGTIINTPNDSNTSKNNFNFFDQFLTNNNEQQNSLNLNLNKTQSILNWENHVYFNDSVINDYFYGLLLSSLTCKKCGSTNVTYEPFNHLGLSIPNEFHLFIYFIPDFRKALKYNLKTVNGYDNNGYSYSNNENDQHSFDKEKKFGNFDDKYFEEKKIDKENKFDDLINNSDNKAYCNSKKKSFPKAVKMFIKINDNMQFKNIIDTVSERLNYPIGNGLFYSVLDNQLVRVIESDERCGELMQRNFFLFLAETNKEDKIDLNSNKNNSNKFDYPDIALDAIDIDKEKSKEANFIFDNQNNLEKNFPFLVNFNFYSFPNGVFNAKQKANPISYPRITNFSINQNNPFFILFILHDLIEYTELIFNEKSQKENKTELHLNESNRPSSLCSNDSASDNFKSNNQNSCKKKKKVEENNNNNNSNSKNKNSNESNKTNKKKLSNNFNKKEKTNISFLDDLHKNKNFLFCNKAVLLEETNTFFTTENTQEKFKLNSKDNSNISANAEKTSSRIKSSLLITNKTRENINNDKSLNAACINSLHNKYICLFCNSVDNNFFYCDCVNEFIIKNKAFFKADKSAVFISLHKANQHNKNDKNINCKNNDDNILNFSSLDFCKIKKNFFHNFLNYFKENKNAKKKSTEFYCEIILFFQEEAAKHHFRLLNYCKDLTNLPQKETLITLYDLLEYFTAEEKLREEKFFCLNCNEWISRVKRLEINKFPNILIVNFKRFRFDIIQPKGRGTRRALESNLNVHCLNSNFNSNNNFNNFGNLNFGGEKNENKIDFPFDLDLTKFNRYNESIQYELYAVCNHEGKISGGHYKAVCKDFQSDKWFEFDDKIVKQISQNQIVSHKAYILFYRRKKEKIKV